MAGDFLRSKGIDIDAEMAQIQNRGTQESFKTTFSMLIKNVVLPGSQTSTISDLIINNEILERIGESGKTDGHHASIVDGRGALLAPSLCHPHVHIDKAYLLSHPKYAQLQVEQGDFKEAMTLTGKAKAQFEHSDLIERGQRVIDESVLAGVTHMRGFVEVDAGVQKKCLDAGIELQQRAKKDMSCHVQLCAFAQLPLFSAAQDDEDGAVIRGLMQAAAANQNVDVIGSTPYVEDDRDKMQRNVEWMIDLSIEHNLHLDFHLDYNLDRSTEPLVWHVLQCLKDKQWQRHTKDRTIVLGHCTRLVLFDDDEWHRLATMITESGLPIHFVGLPTSDLFMMRAGQKPEVRGTLHVPDLIKKHGLNACLGINNIGNAFTPQGTCDPLHLASQGVGIYQAGTKQDAELLYECVSTRAKAAIGVTKSKRVDAQIREDDVADFVLFAGTDEAKNAWKTRQSLSESVYLYDSCQGRKSIFGGRLIRS
ncbi:Cytosine deaminase [Pseudocercospora fuligena]|uniref:Cytosine deaminase n=1 Tax=Pseudocercospora fuligena TaxID=685502 RepID=A0A8H6RCE1_9PEZI|nr:Cytosine deaminase [Pseudocercospora fuligena]